MPLTFTVGSILVSTVTFLTTTTLSLSGIALDLLKAFVMSPNAARFAMTSFNGLSAFLLFGTFRPSLCVFREASCLLLVVIPWPFKFSLTPIGFGANLVGAIINNWNQTRIWRALRLTWHLLHQLARFILFINTK